MLKLAFAMTMKMVFLLCWMTVMKTVIRLLETKITKTNSVLSDENDDLIEMTIIACSECEDD